MISSGRKREIRRSLQKNWSLIDRISFNMPNNKVRGALQYILNQSFFNDREEFTREKISQFSKDQITYFLDNHIPPSTYLALDLILKYEHIYVVSSPIFNFYYLEEIDDKDPTSPYELMSKTMSADAEMFENEYEINSSLSKNYMHWEDENGFVNSEFDYELFFNDSGKNDSNKKYKYFLYKIVAINDEGVGKYIIRGNKSSDNILSIAP
jgi:hypothetical protein